MKNEAEIKQSVKQKYSEIALQDRETNASSCCGATECSDEVYNIMSEDYSVLEGYSSEADLGLGCGLPTQFAKINEGNTVIDLGSGAGNDCFIARAETGESGKVIGIDFTPAMLEKARKNADSLGFVNVEFRKGDIESMPVASETADVVVSNCVLNLVPNKKAVFADIFRVLKPGGHFSISDVVLEGELPEEAYEVAAMYSGCITGAIDKEAYLQAIEEAGFKEIKLQKEKSIEIPEEILFAHLSEEGVEKLKNKPDTIRSVTIFGRKPIDACCDADSDCC